MLGVRSVWGGGVVGRGIRADANATLMAGGGVTWVRSGRGGGSGVGVSICEA